MDTTLRILGLALAFGFITALVVFVVTKFKVTKLIYGAYILFALALLAAFWSFVGPNTNGWDDLIFMVNAMILAAAGVLYLIGLWIFNLIRRKR
ncbi:MAG: hypothetical protein KGZ84_04620 [Erysipelotrichia bacterium]|jgi:hypothetical protein|nr:hypothetical protein [Erysipelotrichia bacterium]